MKNIIIIAGHLLFLWIAIWHGWNDKITMLFSIIPILSSLFFYITANIYKIAQSIHFLREWIIPVKFNWKFIVKFEWKNEESLEKDELQFFLNKLNDFDIQYPSTTDDFTIKNSGRNTEVKTTFNPSNTVFTVTYDSWTSKEFKENIDNHIGKLFEFISEEFSDKKQRIIYSINGKCDKNFTTSNMWKILSEKHESKIDIVLDHEMESEKASITILRNKNKEEIQIPTTFSLKKLSSLIEDYSNLSLIK